MPFIPEQNDIKFILFGQLQDPKKLRKAEHVGEKSEAEIIAFKV